ncbi:MAG: C4-dicarboxylate ABC transporter [Bacteroidetes bacterium]|nr:MAG: C4-dicarboxylate ABC transporter [Bacteroidota bacterium]
MSRRKWYDYVPHPVVMLFIIIVLAAVMTHVLPAGVYDREVIDGTQRVVPGSYHRVAQAPVSFFGIFKALPAGFVTAAPVVFVVLASGIMFGILEKTGTVENTVGTAIRKLGLQRRYLLVFLLTYLFGLLGVVIGYENNIAMVPIAAVVALALGGDLMLAAGLSVGAITVGFGLSPINPYTVGIGHKIAEMPLFSGAGLRTSLCFLGLTLLAWYNVRYFKKIVADPASSLALNLDTAGFQLSRPLDQYTISRNNALVGSVFLGGIVVMLYCVFEYHWGLAQISAIFILIGIVAGLVSRMSGTELSETALKAVAVVAPGAFMVGYATAIKEVLEIGQINDTISHHLSLLLMGLPTTVSAVGMSMCQSMINLMIPSGSGQALATLPIMIPLGEVLGLTRQTTILAFQIGDGVTNLFNPALGGLIAMLSLCRIPFDRWLRFILPLTGLLLLLAWAFLVVGVWVGYR